MASRLQLQTELEELLGSKNVYFQPPESIQMKYPCIRYNLTSGDTLFASNEPYRYYRRYSVTHIHADPDSNLIDVIPMHFKMSRHDRSYTADGLNHDVYTIFY